MRQGVVFALGLVVGFTDSAPVFGGESLEFVVVAGGQVTPVWCGDHVGDLDGVGVERGEQSRRAKCGVFGAWRDQDQGARVPQPSL